MATRSPGLGQYYTTTKLALASWQMPLEWQRERLISTGRFVPEDFPANPDPEVISLYPGEVLLYVARFGSGEEGLRRSLRACGVADKGVRLANGGEWKPGIELVAIEINACLGLGQNQAEVYAKDEGRSPAGYEAVFAAWMFSNLRTSRTEGVSMWLNGLILPEGGAPHFGYLGRRMPKLEDNNPTGHPATWPMVRRPF